MKSLQQVEFEYNDEKFLQSQKALEAPAGGGGPSVQTQLADEMALEELAEDLRSLIYERKFDKAVETIETAWEKLKNLDKDGEAENSDSESEDEDTVNPRRTIERRVQQLVEQLTFELG